MRLKLLQLWLSCQQEKKGQGKREQVKGVKEMGNGKALFEKGKGQWKD